MEAVRIIQALGLKPRRTSRIGSWSGEEQALQGLRAYVKRHLGKSLNESKEESFMRMFSGAHGVEDRAWSRVRQTVGLL